MPKSTSSFKRKKLTPKAFRILHPVHYRIFEILKEEIPVTLIQTCRAVYDELIPKIYERVEIDQWNYQDLTLGVSIDYASDEDAEHRPRKKKKHPDLPIPEAKNNALAFTHHLSFCDDEGACQFIQDCQLCDDFDCVECNSKYTLCEPIFPNIKTLHFGEDLICILAELCLYNDDDEWRIRPDDIHHRLDDFWSCLWSNISPDSLCFEWPKNWNYYYWNEDLDDQDETVDEQDGYWSIKKAMNSILNEISQQASIEYITVHLGLGDMASAEFDVEEISEDMKLVFGINEAKHFKPNTVIRTLWRHFKKIDDPDYLSFHYALPHLDNFTACLEEFGSEKIKTEEKEEFLSFKSRIQFPDTVCNCQA